MTALTSHHAKHTPSAGTLDLRIEASDLSPLELGEQAGWLLQLPSSMAALARSRLIAILDELNARAIAFLEQEPGDAR